MCGCQQCEDGYTFTEYATCGENRLLNTVNAKFHYCTPNDGSDCGEPDVIASPVRDDGSSLNLGKCDSVEWNINCGVNVYVANTYLLKKNKT